ncbi:MAG TPA: glycosyltransferase family 87 protein [Planktothrix sp.]
MASSEKFKKIVGTAIAATGIGFLSWVLYLSLPSFGDISDLPEYYAPARMIVAGQGSSACNFDAVAQAEHQSFPSMRERVVALYVPPPGLALISPIGFVPVSIIPALWKAFMIGCLCASVWFIRRAVNLDYRQTCYLIAGIAFSDACFEALKIDQMAPLLLLSFSSAIYFLQAGKEIPAGLMLSLMILKPQQILPFGAYLIASKRWKTAAVAVVVLAVLTAISLVQVGATGYHDYAEMVRSPLAVLRQQPELTPTFRGQMLRLFPDQAGIIFGISSVLELGAILLGFALGWRWKDRDKAILLGVLTMMPIAVVFSLHCHLYDLLLLAPAVVLFFMDTVLDTSAIFKTLVLVGGMTFMTGISVQLHYEYMLKGGKFNVLFWELLAFAIAILVVALRQTKVKSPVAEPGS